VASAVRYRGLKLFVAELKNGRLNVTGAVALAETGVPDPDSPSGIDYREALSGTFLVSTERNGTEFA